MENNNKIFLKDLGMKIRVQRVMCNMSTSRLSQLSGIDMSNINSIELGKVNTHILTLKAIAEVFNMDIKEFL